MNGDFWLGQTDKDSPHSFNMSTKNHRQQNCTESEAVRKSKEKDTNRTEKSNTQKIMIATEVQLQNENHTPFVHSHN